MKFRVERECSACDTRWSYAATGSVQCPSCGSLRSVGLDERTEQTDVAVSLDLTGLSPGTDRSTVELAVSVRDRCRDYRTARGFLSEGRLRQLDDTYLVATELHHVADELARSHTLDEREVAYFHTLLDRADEGVRPPSTAIPEPLRSARGLAVADAVRAYRRDLKPWLTANESPDGVRPAFDELGEHVTRIRLLDGDVAVEAAETLVDATRDLADVVRDGEDAVRGDETALTRVQDELDRLRTSIGPAST